MASTSAAAESRSSMDRDFAPGGTRNTSGQARESSRSSRRRPSGSSSTAVQYSLPSPSSASFDLKPPVQPYARSPSPISPPAGQANFPTPIRGAHFLPPTASPSPPSFFGRPPSQTPPHGGYAFSPAPPSQSSQGSFNLEVSPSPASRQSQQERVDRGASPTPSRHIQQGGHSLGHSSVPRQPPPMLTSLPLPPTPASGSRERLPSLESVQAQSSPSKQRRPAPAPLELGTTAGVHANSKPKPLLKAGPASLLVAPDPRRTVLSVHSQSADLEGERSPTNASPSRLLFEQPVQRRPSATQITRASVPLQQPSDSSPHRPGFTRGHTAPLLSPPPPPAAAGPSRTAESLTPPMQRREGGTGTGLVDRFRATAPASEGRHTMLRSQTEGPSDWSRRSADMLRASTSSPLGKKEIKALEKEKVKTAAELSQAKAEKTITPRKSSGGLKALFKKAAGSGGKGKEKEKDSGWVEVPPMPLEFQRPSQDTRAPSFAVNRPSYSRDDRSSSATPPHAIGRYTPEPYSYRSTSQSSLVASQQPPSRDLPPLPPPTPVSANSEAASQLPPAVELPAEPAAPTVSATQFDESGVQSPDSASSSSSSTTTHTPALPPSKSLHLLELPELDLSFGFAFDDVRSSPSRSKTSPINRPSPKSPSRSNTSVAFTRSRANATRRRSNSFDMLSSSSSSRELWRTFSGSTASPDSRILSSSTSTTALESGGTDDTVVAVSAAVPDQAANQATVNLDSSHTSQLSSLSDMRTASSLSSFMGESRSPSPPLTPKDERLSLDGAETPVGIKVNADLTIAPTPPTVTRASEKPVILSKPLDYGSPTPSTTSVSVSQMISPLAPAADIKPKRGVSAGSGKVPKQAAPRARALQTRSRRVISASIVPQSELSTELQQLLFSFRYPSAANETVDRAGIVRSRLLHILLEAEKKGFDHFDQTGNASMRAVCFDWADALLFELRVEQPAIERGACLEGLAAILETPCLSARAIESSPQDAAAFRGLMVRVVAFVMTKLGAKGVFHNSLLFSGRVLAFAFFRIPHIAQQLLVTLPTQRQALMRFSGSILSETTVPASICPLSYPVHLRSLCFDDSKSYTTRLQAHRPSFTSQEEQVAFIFRPGNWLRRWQSDDSELFPAFYRAYHRQLAHYLAPAIEYFEARSQPIPVSVLMRAPGYAHLASVFASKCHSYILGSVNAVTTSSSSQAFDATESAGFRGNAKPTVLDTANRRLSETILSFANSRVFVDQTFGGVVEVDGSQLWASIIEGWVKNLISRTSLYAPKGVFCLFDLLDCVADPPADTIGGSHLQISQAATPNSLLDVPHLISVIRLVLTEGEHALTLVKVIAFVFTHYETLCAQPGDRKELCISILLDKFLFERLVLFWSQSVRSYILRLIVFRLGHLHTTSADGDSHDVEIATVRLLNARLDRIRKRHEELEPATEEDVRQMADDLSISDVRDSQLPRSRSTITMVSPSAPRSASAPNKAERLLGLGFDAEPAKAAEAVTTSMGKATSWIKKSFGGKQKKSKGMLGEDIASGSSSRDSSPLLGTSPRLGSSPKTTSSPNPPTVPELPSVMVQRPSNDQPRVTAPTTPPRAPPADTAQSPVSTHSSEEDSTTSANSFEGEPQFLQAYQKKLCLPEIKTTGPDKSSAFFAFEFELPTQSPRSDSFDRAPAPASPSQSPAPPSPGQPASPHMSRSFSKRSSLLPPPTASVLDSILTGPTYESSPGGVLVEAVEEEDGYDAKLHAYAIRMLAELEDAQREYDEWWSDGGIGRLDNAPPRLTVAWPFSEDED